MIRREPWEKFLERYKNLDDALGLPISDSCTCGIKVLWWSGKWNLNLSYLREHWQLGHFDTWEEEHHGNPSDSNPLADRVKEIEYWMVEFRKATDAALSSEAKTRVAWICTVDERLQKLESRLNPLVTIDGKPANESGHALMWKLVVRFMLAMVCDIPERSYNYNLNHLRDDLERLLKTL